MKEKSLIPLVSAAERATNANGFAYTQGLAHGLEMAGEISFEECGALVEWAKAICWDKDKAESKKQSFLSIASFEAKTPAEL